MDLKDLLGKKKNLSVEEASEQLRQAIERKAKQEFGDQVEVHAETVEIDLTTHAGRLAFQKMLTPLVAKYAARMPHPASIALKLQSLNLIGGGLDYALLMCARVVQALPTELDALEQVFARGRADVVCAGNQNKVSPLLTDDWDKILDEIGDPEKLISMMAVLAKGIAHAEKHVDPGTDPFDAGYSAVQSVIYQKTDFTETQVDHYMEFFDKDFSAAAMMGALNIDLLKACTDEMESFLRTDPRAGEGIDERMARRKEAQRLGREKMLRDVPEPLRDVMMPMFERFCEPEVDRFVTCFGFILAGVNAGLFPSERLEAVIGQIHTFTADPDEGGDN